MLQFFWATTSCLVKETCKTTILCPCTLQNQKEIADLDLHEYFDLSSFGRLINQFAVILNIVLSLFWNLQSVVKKTALLLYKLICVCQ